MVCVYSCVGIMTPLKITHWKMMDSSSGHMQWEASRLIFISVFRSRTGRECSWRNCVTFIHTTQLYSHGKFNRKLHIDCIKVIEKRLRRRQHQCIHMHGSSINKVNIRCWSYSKLGTTLQTRHYAFNYICIWRDLLYRYFRFNCNVLIDAWIDCIF